MPREQSRKRMLPNFVTALLHEEHSSKTAPLEAEALFAAPLLRFQARLGVDVGFLPLDAPIF